MTRLNTGFSTLSNDASYHLGITAARNVAGIAAFAEQASLLPPITTAANALQTAMALPARPVHEASVAAAARFSQWFEEFMANQWDRQIEQDMLAGRLDAALQRADDYRQEGRVTPL